MRLVLALMALLALSTPLSAHEGHDHEAGATVVASPASSSGGVETAFKSKKGPTPGATTGSGDLRFKYNAELSKLPSEIADRILRAHGGFAKTPGGDLYFGLRDTGLIHLSADLRTKTLIAANEYYASGGLHNCAYLERDGGLLIIPDDEGGRILIVDLEGNEVKTLKRPPFFPKGNYKPTDIDIASNGKAYVADGYGSTKKVFTIDLETMDYEAIKFGDRVTDSNQTPGRFSTSHGVTFDPTDDSVVVADRERQWVQKFDLDGEFLAGFQTGDSNPCDIDFVDFGDDRLMVVGCLVGPKDGGTDKNDRPTRSNGVVQILRDGEVVSTLDLKNDLGLDQFRHVHNAAGVVRDGKLYVLCYGWNPGCYAVLEHVVE
ncbi:NHL repeat protein [Planctomycetes bacterium MalM25]|nr:NHL repeat protein [Planctomycetes bacterium MalM25]